MNDALTILAKAISDVGWWGHWQQKPERFDVLFGGTQLWTPPDGEGQPPLGAIGLAFQRPESVSFLTHKDASSGSFRAAPIGYVGYPSQIDRDWPTRLQKGALQGFLYISGHCLTFTDQALQRQILVEATRIDTVRGFPPDAASFFALPAWLAFWAGPVGLIVGAEQMAIVDRQQVVPLDQIEHMRNKWWEYWKEYWRLKGTAHPLPEDYACETTVDPNSEAGSLVLRRWIEES